MNRRELFAAGGAGVVGLLLPQKSVAKPVLEGITDEEMARHILDSNDVCMLGKAASGNDSRMDTIYPQYETPKHARGYRRQVHVLGSIITMVTSRDGGAGDIIGHERFDISEVSTRTVQIGWGDEYYGRVGERWFRLGV